MKKPFFLAAAGVLTLVTLAGCGQKEGGEVGTLKVWCADAVVDLTKSQLETFKTEHPEWKVDFVVEAVGEGDAATNMITDPEAGADIYCFAQDQLARLVAAKAIGSLADDAKSEITKNNDAGSVKAGSIGDKVYAYPLTSDNGYFMYYNKDVMQGVDMNDLDAIVAKCEATKTNIAFEGGSAWYNAAFFFGAGCVSEWTTDEKSKFVSYNDTYNSDKGKVAAEGLRKLVNSSAYVNSSGAPGAFAAGASVAVSGTWDFAACKEALGDKLGAAKLPCYTVDGNKIQLGSFSGNKLMGVKPHTDANVATCCKRVALYLTGETCQAKRFETNAWGPSNKNVQKSDAVKANPGLSALAAQNEFATPQGQFPNAWWTLAGALGPSLVGKTTADIPAVLKTYADGLDGCLD